MRKSPQLTSPGWTAENRSRLEQLITAGAGQQLPVVFDFDNTIVCGDIGEATLAMLVRERILTVDRLPESLRPPLISADGKKISLSQGSDITEYYEALLAPTAHGPKDPTPLSNGYAWAVEIMRGLSLLQVVRATQKVMALSLPMREQLLEVTPGKTAYPIPFFYPEIVELIAVLLRHRFEVWIVSASNVWSVRWMIMHGLNPLLRSYGVAKGLAPDHVIGVSTLLADRHGRLYKDAVLTDENPDYAALNEKALKSFTLTGLVQYPVPTYSGKVGIIWDTLGRRPYLCAGDSPGDHAMLSFSEHRLWVARLEKPKYQAQTIKLMDQRKEDDWIIQPVRSRKNPGFIPELSAVAKMLPPPWRKG